MEDPTILPSLVGIPLQDQQDREVDIEVCVLFE
jgi:hypothetical protein